ncbi:anti-sigma factor domain-containing protein [Neobacillus sp. SAB-20_R2A]|uniref:anti-sigma factor domain-containing protein n=1 Tax=Neobacillus sp. SAB-20_R2A TaxID=3120519 RepID=UPI003C6DBC45
MKKGIIMEMDDFFLTLLTPEGEFLRAKRLKQSYSIGEEITFYPVEGKNQLRYLSSIKKVAKMKTVWAAAAAVLLFSGSFIPMYQNNKAYAYMSIDVNPSIELGINKKMQVVELTGYNPEGKKIISHLDDWEKQDVTKVTEEILSEIGKEGYFKTNKHVIISTVPTSQMEKKEEQKLETDIKEITKVVSEQQLAYTVLSGTEKDLETAHEKGVTAGKYKAVNNPVAKEKVENNWKKYKNHNNPTEPEAKAPPGQIKKQIDENVTQEPPAVDNTPQAAVGQSPVEDKVPPGQAKKIVDNQLKQNPGQAKKQANQQGNSQGNPNPKGKYHYFDNQIKQRNK